MRNMKRIACLIVIVASCAFATDHSSAYQVGIFKETQAVSDGSYSSASCGTLGCSGSAYNASHNVHFVQTADGVYTIAAPISVGNTLLLGLSTPGGDAPTVHKAWFMDQLHDGDKVLFAVGCNKHNQCTFWLPNPDKVGKEIVTEGWFAPAVAPSNTTSLCGTGKLTAAVEAQVCQSVATSQQQMQQQQTLRSVAQSEVSQVPAASTAQQAAQQAIQQQAERTNFTSTKGFVLEEETPVRLRLNRTISSADAHVGDTVDFEVLDDITVNGTLVIPKGGLAFATVTEAQAKRRMARGGKLDVNIDYVKLISGEKAALRAVKDVKGGGHTGAMVGGMVATSIVFFPAAPFFLFMHGKDISIPKGTEITAYVSGDKRLDIAKFQPAASTNAPAQSVAASSSENLGSLSAKLHLESDPPGADLEVDGSFVGNTPSDVQVTQGEHTVSVKKTGFKDWERTLKVSVGSSVRLNAELEQVANQ